jgi:hypothetical protein
VTGPGDALRRLLGPAGRDAGCERCFEALDAYVEGELAGRPVAALYPDVATHLAACPDCSQDHDALVDLLRARRPPTGSAVEGGRDGSSRPSP